MLYAVIIALITLLGLGFWLAQPVDSQEQLEHGRYLVEVLGACGPCHLPRAEHGEIADRRPAGGLEIREAFGDPDTGLGRWTDAAPPSMRSSG
jgi:hypothetical protein